MEYPSFWAFLSDEDSAIFIEYNKYKSSAIIFTVAVLLCVMFVLLKSNIRINTLEIFFILSFITIYFLPNMMTRYGFIYEILAIVILCIKPKTLVLYLPMKMIMLYLYGGKCGIDLLPISIQIASWLYLVIMSGYIFLFVKEAKEQNK